MTEIEHRQPLNLSTRELAVLGMVARGMTNGEVGRELEVTVHAVKFHLASIYKKLHVTNRTEAAVAYMRSVDGADAEPATHQ